MNANVKRPRSFWKHYAKRHPKTHRKEKFLEGWGSYNAWYQVDHLNLAVKQLLRTGGNVVVYVTGEKGEDKQNGLARLNPYQEQIAKVTRNYLSPQALKDVLNPDFPPPSAPEPALCANILYLEGGTINPENWDEAVDFMEESLKKYEEIFFHESRKMGNGKTFTF